MTFDSMAAVYILVCAIFLSENEIQSQFAFCTVDDPDDAGTNEKGGPRSNGSLWIVGVVLLSRKSSQFTFRALHRKTRILINDDSTTFPYLNKKNDNTTLSPNTWPRARLIVADDAA